MSAGPSTALITGGNRGIGKAIVSHFLNMGWEVIAAGRDADSLDALKTLPGGERVHPLVADLSDPDAIKRLFDKASQQVKALHVLVNNAGVGIYGPAEDLPIDAWDQMMTINVRGAFLCSQHAFRWMKRTGTKGHIGGFAIYIDAQGGFMHATKT